MKKYKIWQGSMLCAAKVTVADNFFTRFRGLMFRRNLEPGEGMLLKNCSSIHCFFMHFSIDAVYLDKYMAVLGSETVMPNHIGKYFRGARHVLELEKGKGAFLKIGDVIELIPIIPAERKESS